MSSILTKNPEITHKINYTACLVFETGERFFGFGFGTEGIKFGEICFNTSMTGYQEILTDLSYAGQIINFTFPHIGNTGTNVQDNESKAAVALGMICRNLPTEESSWRSDNNFQNWLRQNKMIGIGNIDTRKVTRLIRSSGAQTVAICYSKLGYLDTKKLQNQSKKTKGLKGMELTADVTCLERYSWKNKKIFQSGLISSRSRRIFKSKIIAIDYGAKQAIFDRLSSETREVIIVPAETSFSEVMKLEPDGIFLSNGPGDPTATFKLFGHTIVAFLNRSKVPIFGICLGHQLLGLALGATTIKMPYGHHGANHPVQDVRTGKVEITSMNHGFAIDKGSLPKHVLESHVSLFDGTNCGIEVQHRKVFSVQYHPEASPGPHDSYYLFEKFFNNINTFILST